MQMKTQDQSLVHCTSSWGYSVVKVA